MSALTVVLVSGLVGGVVAAAITLVGDVGEPRPKYAPANRTEALDQARRVRKARNRRVGSGLIALGILVWPAGVILQGALDSAGYVIHIAAFLLTASAALLNRGHQMRAKDALWVLEHDPRPPLVYLRPFAVDRASRAPRNGDAFGTKTDERRGGRRALEVVSDRSYVIAGNAVVHRSTAYIVVTRDMAHRPTVSGDSPEVDAVTASFRVI